MLQSLISKRHFNAVRSLPTWVPWRPVRVVPGAITTCFRRVSSDKAPAWTDLWRLVVIFNVLCEQEDGHTNQEDHIAL